jgi:hypothetical protein
MKRPLNKMEEKARARFSQPLNEVIAAYFKMSTVKEEYA